MHRPCVLANPGPSVGGLTGGPGLFVAEAQETCPAPETTFYWNAAKVQHTFPSTYLPRASPPATQQFSALHD